MRTRTEVPPGSRCRIVLQAGTCLLALLGLPAGHQAFAQEQPVQGTAHASGTPRHPRHPRKAVHARPQHTTPQRAAAGRDPQGAAAAQGGPEAAAPSPAEQSTSSNPSPPDARLASGAETVSVFGHRNYVPSDASAGTKTRTSILDVPQSISVITHDQLGLLQVQTLDQALQFTAGVTTGYQGTDPRFDYIMLRGFVPPRYLDGLPEPTSTFAQSRLDLYGMDQVQVLKGPSSVLYGAIPPGGLVDEVSKRPQTKAFGDINLQLGSFDYREAAFDAGTPLAGGKVLVRLTGLFRDADSQVDYVYTQRWFIAPSVSFILSPDTTFTVLSHYQHDRTNTANQFLPAYGTLLPNPFGEIGRGAFINEPNHDRFSREQYDIGYQLDHRVNDHVSLHQSVRFEDVKVIYDTLYGSGFTLGADGLPTNYRLLNRGSYYVNEDARDVGLDNNAEFKFATGPLRHDVLFGVNYVHYRDDYGVGFGVAPPIDVFDPVYGVQFATPAIGTHTIETQDDVGEYGQDQIKWNRWIATVSGREDEVSTGTRALLYGANTSRDDTAFSWRAGLTYVFPQHVAPYFSYSRSFVPTTGTTYDGSTYAPTTGNQYEVGVKYQLGRRTLVTAAAYQLTENNALTNDPNHPFYSLQQGQERVRGIELEDTTRLSDALSINAAYAYTDGEVTQSNDASTLNKRITQVPRHQASLLVDYTFPTGVLRGFGFGAAGRYVGAVFGDSANVWRTPHYAVMDALMHYDTRRYRVSVNASNLFDTRYLTSCDSAAFCFYGPRRTILGTLTLKFE